MKRMVVVCTADMLAGSGVAGSWLQVTQTAKLVRAEHSQPCG
jgi:hypothetical protein